MNVHTKVKNNLVQINPLLRSSMEAFMLGIPPYPNLWFGRISPEMSEQPPFLHHSIVFGLALASSATEPTLLGQVVSQCIEGSQRTTSCLPFSILLPLHVDADIKILLPAMPIFFLRHLWTNQ